MPSSSHLSTIRSKGNAKIVHEITLLILLADSPVELVRRKHGDYHDIFTSLFERSFAVLPEDSNDFIVTIKSYDVFHEPWEYPSAEELEKASGLLITGSSGLEYLKMYHERWMNCIV